MRSFSFFCLNEFDDDNINPLDYVANLEYKKRYKENPKSFNSVVAAPNCNMPLPQFLEFQNSGASAIGVSKNGQERLIYNQI